MALKKLEEKYPGIPFKELWGTKALATEGWVTLEDGIIKLTEKSNKAIQEAEDNLVDLPAADGAPKAVLGLWAVNQSAVVSNLSPEAWAQLSKDLAGRGLIGLEMEAVTVMQAVAGYNEQRIATQQKVTRVIVTKGVTDFADTDKDDSYQNYCAHVSASWAYVFLSKHGHLLSK